MTTKMIAMTALTALVLLSLGCGKSASDAIADTSAQTSNKTTADGNAAIQDATYTSPCTSSTIPDVGPIKFPGMQTFFELSDYQFTKHVVYFSDADCKIAAFDVRETGNVHVVGKSAAVAGALGEDFNYTNTNITIQNDLVLAAFNAASACGINDWAKATARDTSAQSGSGLCPGKASPRKAADVVLVQNGNQLFLGAGADQDAATPRPTAVDNAHGFLKQ